LKRAGARCTFPADESSLRAQPDLEHMPILNRGNRLSITPRAPDEWRFITQKLAKTL